MLARTFFLLRSPRASLWLMWMKGRYLWGNCNLFFFLGLDSNNQLMPSLWSCRYSNTLFVTFNNRIYFRDHPPPCGLASQSVAIPVQPQPLQSATISHTSTRTNLLHPALVVDPEKGINDALVMSWNVMCAYCLVTQGFLSLAFGVGWSGHVSCDLSPVLYVHGLLLYPLVLWLVFVVSPLCFSCPIYCFMVHCVL
jgi:hypothetical protein